MHAATLHQQLVIHLIALAIGVLVASALLFALKGRKDKWITTLVIVGICCRVAYALATPTFDAPDEEPHFHYVTFLATHAKLPTQAGRTDGELRDWEYYQPPLYYAALAPVYAGARGLGIDDDVAIRVLRLFSIGFWLATLAGVLRIMRNVGIEDGVVKTVAVATCCLLPTYVFITSVINNDNLIICLGTWLLALATSPSRTFRLWAGVGMLLGICLWTKLSATLFAAFLGMFAVVAWRRHSLRHVDVVGPIAAILIGIAIWSPLGLRNLAVYGSLTAEDISNVPKDWPNIYIAVLKSGWQLHWSFWASSGIVNDVRGLFPYAGIAALYGAICYCLWRHRRDWITTVQTLARNDLVLVFTATVLLALALVFRFGLLYGQAQGRLLFPLIAPIAIALAFLARCATATAANDERTIKVTSAVWIGYGTAFVAYSLCRFAIVPSFR